MLLNITMVAKVLDDNKRDVDDFDDNEDGKKAIGLDEQNDYFACASSFFAHLLPSLYDCDMIPPNFTRPLYGVGEHNTRIFFFVNLDTVLWYLTQKFRQHLTN